MSALFNLKSLLLVILLLVCTSAYVHALMPAILDRNKDGRILEVREDRREAESVYEFMLHLYGGQYVYRELGKQSTFCASIKS